PRSGRERRVQGGRERHRALALVSTATLFRSPRSYPSNAWSNTLVPRVTLENLHRLWRYSLLAEPRRCCSVSPARGRDDRGAARRRARGVSALRVGRPLVPECG